MSVRPDEAFGRAVSRRELFQRPAIGCHLLYGLSTAFGLAAVLTAASLLDVWLGNPSASSSPFSIVRTAIDRIRDPFTSTSQASIALLASVTAMVIHCVEGDHHGIDTGRNGHLAGQGHFTGIIVR